MLTTRLNNTYEIRVESPLLRPGITITTKVSEKYLDAVVDKLMAIIRKINDSDKPSEAKE